MRCDEFLKRVYFFGFVCHGLDVLNLYFGRFLERNWI